MTDAPDPAAAAPADPPPAAAKPTRPPLIEAPLYVSGAPVPAAISRHAMRVAPPVMGAVGIAIVSAVAGYFVPKLLDRFAADRLAWGPEPQGHGEPVEFEIDDDD